MKHLTIILAALLISVFAGTLYAEAGCSSCSSVESCSDAYTDKACKDDACESTDPAHKHEKESVKEDAVKSPVKDEASVNTSGLKTLIDSGVPLIILDARSGKYDDGKRIAGALSLNAESKAEEIAKVLPKKDALIVTYCANLKCPASNALYKHLKSLGYSNLIEYPEGIQGWIEAGNPVKSAK
ncbi:MAG: rhodanese-related sulfurtransferase [uncultured bacterium]|nr:MAG: rhodanese-related sulfurtransferase [uncultured bacterium]